MSSRTPAIGLAGTGMSRDGIVMTATTHCRVDAERVTSLQVAALDKINAQKPSGPPQSAEMPPLATGHGGTLAEHLSYLPRESTVLPTPLLKESFQLADYRVAMALWMGAAAVVFGAQLWAFAFTHRLRSPKPKTGRFAVRRVADEEGGWILQGSGGYDCNLRFASWQEAMQAVTELTENSQ